MDKKRVAVFIDNSNVFHHIYKLKEVDKNWTTLYDPFLLAQKLTGNRELIYVGFYCVRHPCLSFKWDGGRGEKI